MALSTTTLSVKHPRNKTVSFFFSGGVGRGVEQAVINLAVADH